MCENPSKIILILQQTCFSVSSFRRWNSRVWWRKERKGLKDIAAFGENRYSTVVASMQEHMSAQHCCVSKWWPLVVKCYIAEDVNSQVMSVFSGEGEYWPQFTWTDLNFDTKVKWADAASVVWWDFFGGKKKNPTSGFIIFFFFAFLFWFF